MADPFALGKQSGRRKLHVVLSSLVQREMADSHGFLSSLFQREMAKFHVVYVVFG